MSRRKSTSDPNQPGCSRAFNYREWSDDSDWQDSDDDNFSPQVKKPKLNDENHKPKKNKPTQKPASFYKDSSSDFSFDEDSEDSDFKPSPAVEKPKKKKTPSKPKNKTTSKAKPSDSDKPGKKSTSSSIATKKETLLPTQLLSSSPSEGRDSGTSQSTQILPTLPSQGEVLDTIGHPQFSSTPFPSSTESKETVPAVNVPKSSPKTVKESKKETSRITSKSEKRTSSLISEKKSVTVPVGITKKKEMSTSAPVPLESWKLTGPSVSSTLKPSSSSGIRVGLSRRIKLKPLHPSVKINS